MQPRRVPWTDFEEWCDVRGWLLSRDPAQTLTGLKRLSAWRSRGRVPIAVDATCNIARALLLSDGDEAARLALGLAVIRCVNGLTDAAQIGAFAMPVAAAAARIGLPRFLVDLRHASTHGAQLPPAPQLREACEVAIAWLSARYWAQFPAENGAASAAESVASALAEYRAQFRAETAAIAAAKAAPFQAKLRRPHAASQRCLGAAVAAVQQQQQKSALADALVATLIGGGFLVPATPKPRPFDALPDALLRMWSPALERFAAEWPLFAPSFAMLVARRVVERAEAAAAASTTAPQRRQFEYEQSLLACWFAHVAQSCYAGDIDRSSLLALVHCVMGTCFPPRSKWTELVVDHTIALADGPLLEKLRALRAVSTVAGGQAGRLLSKPKEAPAAAPRRLLDIEEMEARVAELKRSAAERARDPEPWSLVATPLACPIGLLPPDCVLPAELDLPFELDDVRTAPAGCYVRFADGYAEEEIAVEQFHKADEVVDEIEIEIEDEDEAEETAPEAKRARSQSPERVDVTSEPSEPASPEPEPEPSKAAAAAERVQSRFAQLL